MEFEALMEQARRVRAIAERSVATQRALVGDVDREMHLAATWHLRRAAVQGSVDNAIFGHGSAEQALDGLDLNPIAMLGLKAAGAIVYPWLIEAAAIDPLGDFVDHARAVLLHPRRRAYCVALGAYHRFQWKSAVYQREVVAWKARPAAKDPRAPWRRRPVTAKQRHLIEVIVECLSAVDPNFTAPVLPNRGAAHDWLDTVGGNPLFWHPPALPRLDTEHVA